MKRRNGSFLRLLVLAALAAAIMLTAGIVAFSQELHAPAQKECYLPGDMNQDGEFSNRDAIHILYNSFFADEYPLAQEGDINGDGKINSKDAIELLYESLNGASDYAKVKHDYYDPAWTWTETNDGATATVLLKCGCGQDLQLNANVTEAAPQAASCTEAGHRSFVAEAAADGWEGSSSYTLALPASGHNTVPKSEELRHFDYCQTCKQELNVSAHAWEKSGAATTATCLTQAQQDYACACGKTKTEYLGFAEHSFAYVEKGDVQLAANACEYAKVYKCTQEGCNETKQADNYINHNYVTLITKEATCQEDGEKVSKCTVCQDVRSTTPIPANEDHEWFSGPRTGGVIYMDCLNCNATKTVAAAASDGTVSQDVLQNATELNVGDATVAMDDNLKDSLKDAESVKIEVGTVSKDAITGLDADKKKQIGDNMVYDFTLTSGNDSISQLGGKVTITLPYTPGENEDVDAIAVWYIFPDGEVVEIEATYSNGYITFETNHFSYYTVTRLTPAERCAKYGTHIEIEAVVAPTCTEGGYSYKFCQRCGVTTVESYDEKPATDHDYKVTADVKATCEGFGIVTKTCANCKHSYSDVTAALGHDISEKITDASCVATGLKEYSCSRCDYKGQQVIPQLQHAYKRNENADLKPTCDKGGYEAYVCDLCGAVDQRNPQPATGHKFQKDNAQQVQWIWNNYSEDPTLVLRCACGFVKELKPTVERTAATCEGAGSVTARIAYNSETYTKTMTGEPAKGHNWDQWTQSDTHHYRKCQQEGCGKVEAPQEHSFDKGVVTVEASCLENGKMTYTCTICKYTKEAILPSKGGHSYDNGKVEKAATCLVDGLKVLTCENCGNTKDEVIKAAGSHSYDDGKVTLAATCLEAGIKTYTCVVCKETKNETIQPVGSHSYDDGKVTKQPNCVNTGIKTYTCLVCGNTETSVLPATGQHVFEDGVCTGCGLLSNTCDHTYKSIYHYDLAELGLCGGAIGFESCDCGENSSSYAYFECRMKYVAGKDDLEFYECVDCGAMTMVTYTTEFADDCRVFYNYSGVLGHEALEEDIAFAGKMGTVEHTYVYDLQLVEGATSCADGVLITENCAFCDYTMSRTETNDCHAYPINWECLLDDDAYCMRIYKVEYDCACGKSAYMELDTRGQCEFDFVSDGEKEYMQCTVCGLIVLEESERIGNVDGEPCKFLSKEYVACYSADWEMLFEVSAEVVDYRHNYEYTAILLGETCDDGYYMALRCANCGDVQQDEPIEVSYGCETVWGERVVILEDAAYCTSIYQWNEGCACGKLTDSYLTQDGECDFRPISEENESLVQCAVCGLIAEASVEKVQVEGEPCLTVYVQDLKLYSANGELIASVHLEENDYRHEWRYTYELVGETCDDGYYETGICVNCGKQGATSEIMFGCQSSWLGEEELLSAEECNLRVTLNRYACACGKYDEWNLWVRSECEWNWQRVDFLDQWANVCQNCGFCYTQDGHYERIEGEEGCWRMSVRNYSFYKNDEYLTGYTTTQKVEYHNEVPTFELLGKTCDDGYSVQWVCADCGVVTGYGDVVYGCNPFEVERIAVLDDPNYCSQVYLVRTGCACGKISGMEHYTMGNCEWGWEYIEEFDCETNVCVNCGLYVLGNETTQDVAGKPSCYKEKTITVSCYRDGEVVGTASMTGNVVEHQHAYSYQLVENGKTCDDGYTMSAVCAYCGIVLETSSEVMYGCEMRPVKDVVIYESATCNVMIMHRTLSCACGKQTNKFFIQNRECMNESVYKENLDRYVDECVNCGLYTYQDSTYYSVEGQKECYKMAISTYYCYIGDKCVGSHNTERFVYQHNYEAKYTLLGDTCEDGYTITHCCTYCDAPSEKPGETQYGHNLVLREKVMMLDDPAYCTKVYKNIRKCLCGKEQSESIGRDVGCNWEWQYVESLKREANVCVNCGLCYTYESTKEAVAGKPVCYMQYVRKYAYYANGVLLAEMETQNIEYNHYYTYSLKLTDGKTCDDGYSFTGTCVECGDQISGNGNGCDYYLKRIETILDSSAICGGMYREYYGCACGKMSNENFRESNCSMEYVYDEMLQRGVDRCTVCGICRYEETTHQKVEGKPDCYRLANRTTYYLRDGKQLAAYHDSYDTAFHLYVHTLKLNGKTCDEGFTYEATCVICDDNQTGGGSSCGYWTLSAVKVMTGDHACSDFWVTTEGCACGKNSNIAFRSDCNFNNSRWDEELQRDVFTCSTCGATYSHKDQDVPNPDIPCKVQRTRTYYTTVQVDGDTLVMNPVTVTILTTSHTYVYRYNLLGKTCEDGYTYYRACGYCGFSRPSDETIYYTHDTRRTEAYSLAAYGMCRGVYYKYSCACGKNEQWNLSNLCPGLNWVDELQADYCAQCDIYLYEDSTQVDDYENCNVQYTKTIKLLKGNKELKWEKTVTYGEQSHNMLCVGSEKLEDSMYRVYMKCAFCDETEVEEVVVEDHYYRPTGITLLPEGTTCGGYLRQYECICCDGAYFNINEKCEMTHVSDTNKEIDGQWHHYYVQKCTKCDLRVEIERWHEIDESTCTEKNYNRYDYYLGNQLLDTLYNVNQHESHNYQLASASLLEGSVTCADGIRITESCQRCDKTNEFDSYEHRTFQKGEGIDLAPYGAICGTYLEHWGCACGERASYEFTQHTCDTYRVHIEEWIPNTVNTSISSVEGYWDIYSYAYECYCAVTDPEQCHMKVRMAEYYLAEGCKAVQYQTWQLGYTETVDPTTGEVTSSWDKEITIATGTVHIYHVYDRIEGANHTVTYQCKNCASNYVIQEWYENDLCIKSQITYNQAEDFNGIRQRVSVMERIILSNGNSVPSLNKTVDTYFDGSTEWYQNVFTYDVANDCLRTETYTDSQGGQSIYYENHAVCTYTWNMEKAPTCSQYGMHVETRECQVCGKVEIQGRYDIVPDCHNWNWNYDLQTHECTRCGLQNINGADGSIVVEDMSQQYGENTNYVIGYWIRTDVEFTVYASVILDDRTEDNELILEFNDFTHLNRDSDGICALSASQAAVQAAAEAALAQAGYSGSYAIRITFVPINGDGTLDYAITFDSQTA